MSLRTLVRTMAAFTALALAALGVVPGEAQATALTPDQVETTCSTKIIKTDNWFGCKRSCGDGKTCGYICETGGKNCHGCVINTSTGQCSKGIARYKFPAEFQTPPQGGILR